MPEYSVIKTEKRKQIYFLFLFAPKTLMATCMQLQLVILFRYSKHLT